MSEYLELDGSEGEGGGQILRTSLSLSCVTGRPLKLVKIRAGRARPGLLRQHLTCVQAAMRISNAAVEGATLGSQTLLFWPQKVRGGELKLDIGSAGSTLLVAQTLLPPLLFADRPSKIVITGGTHNSAAPPHDFVAESFLPILRAQGANVSVQLEKYGFYPAGGGQITLEVTPTGPLKPMELLETGRNEGSQVTVLMSILDPQIARRELAVLAKSGVEGLARGEERRVESPGPGNMVMAKLRYEQLTVVLSAVGERGVPAEQVSQSVIDQVKRFRQHGVPVDEHLADQLLLPMALAGGGHFRTGPLSLHAQTNISTIQRFMPGRFSVETLEGGCVEIGYRPQAGSQ